MEMEGMVADAPGDCALLVARLIGLALKARVHDVVPADGTVVDVNVPSPESNSIPLFDFKNLFLRHVGDTCSSVRTCHVDIGFDLTKRLHNEL